MSFEIITSVLIFIFGVMLIVQDWKLKAVSLFPVSGFLLSCIFDFIIKRGSICLYSVVIFLVIGLLYQLILHKKAFGIADYIVIFAISFILPDNYWPLFIILIGVFGILIGVIRQENRIPFIPALLFAIFLIKIFCIIKS